MDYDGKNFNMDINDDLYTKKYKQMISSYEDDFPERNDLFYFFTHFTISDKERIGLWKVRIGNALKIDSCTFEVLK